MTNGHEKSDSAIVAVKPANKVAHPAAEQSAAKPATAEPVEPRAGTKGNAGQQTMPWAQSQTSMSHALERIRKVARERKKEKFTALFHHIGSDHRLIPGVDRFEPVLRDAKRHRAAFVVASPDRKRASGADLLQQAGADELINNLSGGFAFDVRRRFNSAIIAQ